MTFNRIRVSQDAAHRLKMLKGRTGITPNLMCRIAFCDSLNDPRPPSLREHSADGLEFNRFTLTGELDAIFMALLRERCIRDGLNPNDEEILRLSFTAHINRGVLSVFNKVKGLEELAAIIPPYQPQRR